VVVYTSVDDLYAKEIFAAFTKDTGIRVLPVFDTEESKTLGLVHRLIAEKDHPQADVFWSGDCARSALSRRRASSSRTGSRRRGDRRRVARSEQRLDRLRRPRPRDRLQHETRQGAAAHGRGAADPKWKGKIAVANPLFGTTAAHVAALAQTRGEEPSSSCSPRSGRTTSRFVGGNSHVRDLVARGDCAAGSPTPTTSGSASSAAIRSR
jgi:iron(III) transport system substrate-binding protein